VNVAVIVRVKIKGRDECIRLTVPSLTSTLGVERSRSEERNGKGDLNFHFLQEGTKSEKADFRIFLD